MTGCLLTGYGMWENIFASSIVLIVLIVLIAVLFGLLNLRKLKSRREYFKRMHQNMKTGQNVIIAGNMYGILTRVGDETVDIKVKSGAIIEVSRYAVTEIL